MREGAINLGSNLVGHRNVISTAEELTLYPRPTVGIAQQVVIIIVWSDQDHLKSVCETQRFHVGSILPHVTQHVK